MATIRNKRTSPPRPGPRPGPPPALLPAALWLLLLAGAACSAPLDDPPAGDPGRAEAALSEALTAGALLARAEERFHSPLTGSWLTSPRAAAPNEGPLAALWREAAGPTLRASLPRRGDWATRITAGPLTLEVTPVGARPTPGETVERAGLPRARVLRGVYPETDAVHLADARRAEEYLLLRGEAAPRRFAWDLSVVAGSGKVRLLEGTVELLDAEGDAWLRLVPPYLLEGDGRRHELEPRLEAGRLVLEVPAAARRYPLLLDPGWVSTGQMVVSRDTMEAVPLASGKVLTAGGREPAFSAAAELYNPQKGTWTRTGSMSTTRAYHTLTRLPSGKVLALGGTGAGGAAAGTSAELFDPKTGTWSAAGTFTAFRFWHAAVRLASGKVLICGGSGQSSCDLYDETTGSFSPTGAMTQARGQHTLTLLASGKVLAAGGTASGALNSAELYDPTTGKWAATGAMTGTRYAHTATLLKDGTVLVAGGMGTGKQAAERFQPKTGKWSAAGTLSAARDSHAAARLPSGQVLLVAGDVTRAVTELYTPAQNSWQGAGKLSAARWAPIAVTLDKLGTVLVAGDNGGAGSAKAELFDPTTGLKCTGASSCASGHCVDGICCDAACTATCFGCVAKVTAQGSLGRCLPIAQGGQDPTATPPCAGSNTCDGAGKCSGSSGQKCTQNTQCSSNRCVDGYCCDAACTATCKACNVAGKEGVCSPVPRGQADLSAASPCSGAGRCDGAGVCKAGNGQSCKNDTECASDICVDGVCCDKECTLTCRSCALAGSRGTCTMVPKNKDPDGECIGKDKVCGGTCDGAGQCDFPGLGKACGTCKACDGTGRCNKMPPDDATCGTIDCDKLDTSCFDYHDLVSGRCASFGSCKQQNSTADCTRFDRVAGCAGTDATPAADAGTTAPPGEESGGCTLSGAGRAGGGTAGLLPLLALVLGLALGRRRVTPRAAVFALATLGLLAVAGCADQAEPGAGIPTASGQALERAPQAHLLAARYARTFAPRFVTALPLLREGGAFAASRPEQAAARGPALSVRLPARSGEPLELSAGPITLEVRPLGRVPARGELQAEGRVLAFPRVGIGTSALHLLTAEGTEEFLLLGARQELHRFVYRLTMARGQGSVRNNHGVVEVLDAEGDAWIRLAPMVVEDAEGRTRAVQPRLSGDLLVVEFAPGDLRYPLLLDPGWTHTAAMATARMKHTATLLKTGEVLVAGGGDNNQATALAELYDPQKRTFTTTGSLSGGRYSHTATLLTSGKVLVAGGGGAPASLNSAELYDPQTGRFSGAGTLTVGRVEHTATLLKSGKVLLAGGYGSGARATAELYEPKTGTFSASKGTLAFGRHKHGAVRLTSGKVLLVGGDALSKGYQKAELYDESKDAFSATGHPGDARESITPVLLNNGMVLVAGGGYRASGGNLSLRYKKTAELYDETSGTWSATGSLAYARGMYAAGLLAGGVVLLAGGADYHLGLAYGRTELYDPKSGTWSQTVSMDKVRFLAATTELANGTVLVTGGTNGSAAQKTAETFAGSTGNPCTAASQCASGFCVDGVCCGTACQTPCYACNLAGTLGICTRLAKGTTDPKASIPCSGSSFCDGKGGCVKKAGVACTAASQCDSGHCVDGFCCGSACHGVCQACNVNGKEGVCSPVPAGQPDLKASTPCSNTRACDGKGVCLLKSGQSCKNSTECATYHCVDGVCCDAACTKTCRACDLAGKVGVCSAVPKGKDPDGECIGKDTACGGACDGAGQCEFPGIGKGCGLCKACNGAGRCNSAPPDDPNCGVIDCDELDSSCYDFKDLLSGRCGAFGSCKTANSTADCTSFDRLPGCTAKPDGGSSAEGGTAPPPANNDGGGCSAGGSAPSAPLATPLALLLLLALRRRP